MVFRKLAKGLALFGWLPLLSIGCGGASFDDPSVIKGLRVIAVQKSSPYPKPGEQVSLKLLFWDAKSTEDNPRDLTISLFTKPSEICVNPPGDLYFNCFAPRDGGAPDDDLPEGGLADGGGSDADMSDAGVPEAGTSSARSPMGRASTSGAPPVGFVPLSSRSDARFPNFSNLGLSELVSATRVAAAPVRDIDHVREATLTIPSKIIENHPKPPNFSEEQRYGLAYVLFVACAGTPRPILSAGPNSLPFGCFAADGRQLGADDFVIGYTSMYVYNDRPNGNPVIDDFLFDNASLKDSIADDASTPHIPSCQGDRAKCPKHVLKPVVNRELTVEKDGDPSAVTRDGRRLDEQVWVNYYLTAGEYKSSVRLVNDATTGWNEKNEAEFTAPAEPGPVRVFAAVHDNRGGVAWVEGKIIID